MPGPADPAHRRLALLIATSDYHDPALRQLRAPGRDASDLAEVLAAPQIGGFAVQTLINGRCGELLEAIEEFCADRRIDDQLLIYLSCHGVLDDRGRLYYAATDTRRQRTAATAVGAAWLNERLEDCRARSQIVLLDCCHSGAFASGAKGQPDLALEQRFKPIGRGRVVLTASRGTEYSFEGDQPSGEGVQSVFTQAIVDGLRSGDADRDKDGLITVTDIYHHVYERVRAAEPRQTPELWTYGAEGDVLLAYSVRGAVIEPVALPEDLRVTLQSPRPRVRETAVAELAELLDAARPGLALSARQALHQISDEDIPRVAAVARVALEAPQGTAAREVSRELADRDQRERARQEAEQAAERQAEEQARREAQQAAERQAEEQARQEAEQAAERQAEEQARQEAEQAAERQAEEQARQEAQQAAERQAEEQARQEAQQAAERQAEEPARQEAIRDEAETPGQLVEDLAKPPAPEPGPGKETQRAPPVRPVRRASSRRLVIIIAGAGIAVIGLITAIIIASGTPHATGTPHLVIEPKVSWTYTSKNVPPTVSSPAVADGTVYVGNWGHAYALDAATGHLRWTQITANSASDSTPAVADGTVYIGAYTTASGCPSSGCGVVYALDAATGHVRWTQITGTNFDFTPAVAGGTVYVGSEDDTVYALDAATGHVRWAYTTASILEARGPGPVVAGGTVYVGSNDAVYALDAATGQVRWSHTTGGLVSSPAVADGTVCIGSTETGPITRCTPWTPPPATSAGPKSLELTASLPRRWLAAPFTSAVAIRCTPWTLPPDRSAGPTTPPEATS